jgi:hypothetical protein
MWGWKAVERLIEPSVSFDDAKQILQRNAFRLRASQPGFAVFERPGTDSPWTTPSLGGLFLQLRYATFVLFDTGDLSRLADEIAELLLPAESAAETTHAILT